MKKTTYDLAVWKHHSDGEVYAFPIGAKDSWDEEIHPSLNSAEWTYQGTLPKGLDVSNVKPMNGNRVKCTIAGANGVNTADWAFA